MRPFHRQDAVSLAGETVSGPDSDRLPPLAADETRQRSRCSNPGERVDPAHRFLHARFQNSFLTLDVFKPSLRSQAAARSTGLQSDAIKGCAFDRVCPACLGHLFGRRCDHHMRLSWATSTSAYLGLFKLVQDRDHGRAIGPYLLLPVAESRAIWFRCPAHHRVCPSLFRRSSRMATGCTSQSLVCLGSAHRGFFLIELGAAISVAPITVPLLSRSLSDAGPRVAFDWCLKAKCVGFERLAEPKRGELVPGHHQVHLVHKIAPVRLLGLAPESALAQAQLRHDLTVSDQATVAVVVQTAP